MSMKILCVLSVIGVFVGGCTKCNSLDIPNNECNVVAKSKPKSECVRSKNVSVNSSDFHSKCEKKKIIIVSQDYYEPTYSCCNH